MLHFEVPEHLPEFIKEHVREYLATNGEQGHEWDSKVAGGPGPVKTLLLAVRGRSSGKALTIPLIYGRHGAGYVVVASKGGAPADPAWYLNLLADPNASVQVGAQRFDVRARAVEGEERALLWRLMRGIYPPYDDYQARTERTIPVLVLEPTGEQAP